MKDFQNYVGRLNNVVGSEKANAIISNAVFLISAGNNDLAISFPTRGILYGGLPGYTDQLVRWTNDLLKVHNYYFQDIYNCVILLVGPKLTLLFNI